MPISDFIKEIYECIRTYSCCASFSPSVFAEGPDALRAGYTGTQEYALLRNAYATDFYEISKIFSKTHPAGKTVYILEKSRLLHGDARISHSCYPKNLRRWMNGTIPRKQKCRMDFCILTWCWCHAWLAEIEPNADMEAVKCSLKEICDRYTKSIDDININVLWNACDSAYRDTLMKPDKYPLNIKTSP